MRLVANKDYWRGAPKVDEVIFQTYQNQDTMAQDLKTGAIQTGWNIPSAQFDRARAATPDLEAIRAVTIGFDELGFNCADKKVYPKSTGQPGAAGPGLPQRAAVGRSTRTRSSPSATTATPRRPTPSSHATSTRPRPTTTGRRRPTPTPSTSTRPRRRSTRPGTPTATATASASTRASPSSCACTRAPSRPESQNCGKLITGWFEDIGLDIDYQVIDDGALGDKQYNYDGDEYAPDFDMFIWGWGGDVDPNFILSVLTTELDRDLERLHLVQRRVRQAVPRAADDASTCRSASRSCKQMQQIVYDESPYIPLVYPLDLEAANTGTVDRVGARQREQGRLVVQHPAGHVHGRAPRRPRRRHRRRRVEHRRHRRRS